MYIKISLEEIPLFQNSNIQQLRKWPLRATTAVNANILTTGRYNISECMNPVYQTYYINISLFGAEKTNLQSVSFNISSPLNHFTYVFCNRKSATFLSCRFRIQISATFLYTLRSMLRAIPIFWDENIYHYNQIFFF